MADEKPQFSFAFDPTLENDVMGWATPQAWDEDDDELPLAQKQEIPLFPDATPRNQYEPLNPDEVPELPNTISQGAPGYADRPAEERTRELFAYMRPHRLMLLGILGAAARPAGNDAISDVVEDLRRHKYNVYSTANLCSMLEQAGALERVLEDGRPYSDYEPAPAIVEIDGEEYYEPTDPPQVHWLTSEAGQTMLDENDPVDRMRTLLEREPEMAPIYKQVLLFCDEAGRSMADLSEEVDANPAIAEPRRFFVQHFVEGIERCEGVAWEDKSWKTTEIGRRLLDELFADVEAAPKFDPYEKTLPTDGRVNTETQGVNW